MPKIICKWKELKRCMINPDGQVFQCCYLKEDFPVNHFRTEWAHDPVVSKYDFYENNLKNHTLKNILNNEWFTKILPDSWKDPDTAPVACQNNCKVE